MKYNILFNKTLKKFVSELTTSFPELKESIDKCYHFEDLELLSKVLSDFVSETESCFLDFLNKNEIIFSEHTILQSIDFKFIWESEISPETIHSIWNYLHTLYLYGYSHIHKIHLIKLMEIANKPMDDTVKDIDKHPIEILQSMNLSNKSKDISLDDDIDKSTSSDTFNLPGMADILEGPIGKLASDIAGEIDIDKLNIDQEDPSKLLQNLMSGENMESSGLMDIVKDVTSKIQDKISSGNVNESDLFSEAQQIMNKFSGAGDSSPFSMISKMAKDLQGGGAGGQIDPSMLSKYGNLMNNLNIPTSNKNVKIDKNKLSLLEKKEKMR
jgi:hypothetical protein